MAAIAVLSLALLLTGWYSASVLDDRTSTLRAMVDRTEPLAESAQVLYSFTMFERGEGANRYVADAAVTATGLLFTRVDRLAVRGKGFSPKL